jgi:hypothetical protein
MNPTLRLLIVAGCGLLCAAGIAADTHKPTFKEMESVIRRDAAARSQHGRMEFGSVRIQQGTTLAEIIFVADDGRVQPFLYKLLPEKNSWKIVNVQRIWFVPRSRLLRGVRV